MNTSHYSSYSSYSSYCAECVRPASRLFEGLCAWCRMEADPLGKPKAPPICARCCDRVPAVSPGHGYDELCDDCHQELS